MNHEHKTISLGFTENQFPPGIHVCQIFTDEDERQESVLKFLLSGLLGKERTSCFSETVTAEILIKPYVEQSTRKMEAMHTYLTR